MRSGTPVIYLHIGAPKTGTSALQVLFSKNMDSFEKLGVVYPKDSSVDFAKRELITSGNGMAVAKLIGAPGTGSVSTDNVLPQIGAGVQKGKSILFSCEHMSEFDVHKAKKFRHDVLSLGCQIRCVVYLRAPVDYEISLYSQAVKMGITSKSFEEYVALHRFGGRLVDLVARIREVFHPNEIISRNYDAAKKRGIFRDFLENGLRLGDFSSFRDAKVHINRSLSEDEIAWMRVRAPWFRNTNQALRASQAMIYRAPNKASMRRISPASLQIMEEGSGEVLAILNDFIADDPLVLKTDDIMVADEPVSRKLYFLSKLVGPSEKARRLMQTVLPWWGVNQAVEQLSGPSLSASRASAP